MNTGGSVVVTPPKFWKKNTVICESIHTQIIVEPIQIVKNKLQKRGKKYETF